MMLKIWFALVAITITLIVLHSQCLNTPQPPIGEAVQEIQKARLNAPNEGAQKQVVILYP